ncbi:glutathione S-transferase T3 [Medicago truncatula]|uniref:glutathione S-transferase T3 n=1 Tax=Medicago truncatula TaxID=3880 RepID=UPI001967CE3B|nr:glutathione S-transferase T3-like [Medicago truncatula]
MGYPSQTPPFNGYMPMMNENFQSVGEYPEYSTQINRGGMTRANEVIPIAEDTTPKSKRNPQPGWNTEQNLVLISGWIKFGTCSVVGRNQTSEAYWGKIVEYCNEHCSFDPPRDIIACRNRFNYTSKVINKWIGAYESAKRLQGSGWSEDDVLVKVQELFACGKNVQFTLKEEWRALRDQPRYGSQMGGNVGSGSSGSKRSHEDSVGSSARPMGREATKLKGKKKSKDADGLEQVEKEWVQFKEIKVQEIEQLKEFNSNQQEKNRLKKMKLYVKLSSEEHLDDRKKARLEELECELF